MVVIFIGNMEAQAVRVIVQVPRAVVEGIVQNWTLNNWTPKTLALELCQQKEGDGALMEHHLKQDNKGMNTEREDFENGIQHTAKLLGSPWKKGGCELRLIRENSLA